MPEHISSQVHSVGQSQRVTAPDKTQLTSATTSYANLIIQQGDTQEDSLLAQTLHASNLARLAQGSRPIGERARERISTTHFTEKEKKVEESESPATPIEQVSEAAEIVGRKNREMEPDVLVSLRGRISKKDSPEEILRKVLNSFPDVSIADEALDFLIETSEPEIAENVKAAKELLQQRHGREVKAGKNIAPQVEEAKAAGLGSSNVLRDLYREITGNPRPPATLFEELAEKYDYGQLRGVIKFLLHSLGSDLNSEGPSIDRPRLHVLFTEVRTLQAILGTYLFFMNRIPLLKGEFSRMGIPLPAIVNFETLAKTFTKFIQDRFPAPEKLQLLITGYNLKHIPAQIVVLQQMRDAIANVSRNMFRNEQHKRDVLASFITYLSDLEDLLEEEQEEGEEEEEKRRKTRNEAWKKQQDEQAM